MSGAAETRLCRPMRYLFSFRTRRQQRRAAAPVGLNIHVRKRAFRSTDITAYLSSPGTRENVQAMEAPESPRIKKLHDRRR
jgi:hypothetical protein